MDLDFFSIQFAHGNDEAVYKYAIDQLRVQTIILGTHFSLDGKTRQAYAFNISRLDSEFRMKVLAGHLSWKEAAKQANALRNLMLEIQRGQSSTLGRAIAVAMKESGISFNALIAHNTLKLYGQNADFTLLSVAEKNAVYGAIIESSARSSPRVTALMRILGPVGKGLMVLSLGIAVYNVMTADNKTTAILHEAGITAAGAAGGWAGAAVAGLACGPGAPVCVGLYVFVVGAAAALGVSLLM